MSKTQTTAHTAQSTQCQKPPRKLSFTQPRIYPLGNIVATTGQGGSSSQYDSYSGNRS